MGDNDALDLAATTFPILSLTKRAALVSRNADELPTCGKGGLRNGWFNSLLLVDSNGQGWVVNGARKLHGVGPFWGYNIFLNQRIKVDLLISDGPFRASVEDVRNRVLKSLRNWHGGATEGGVEELKQAVEGAASISEIISLLEKNQDQPLQEKSWSCRCNNSLPLQPGVPPPTGAPPRRVVPITPIALPLRRGAQRSGPLEDEIRAGQIRVEDIP